MVRCVSIDVFIGSFEYRFGCRFEHRFEGYSGVGFEYGLVRRIVTSDKNRADWVIFVAIQIILRTRPYSGLTLFCPSKRCSGWCPELLMNTSSLSSRLLCTRHATLHATRHISSTSSSPPQPIKVADRSEGFVVRLPIH